MIDNSKKILAFLIALFALGIIFFIGSSFLIGPRVIEIIPFSASVSENLSSIEQNQKEIITVILVGDIMLNRGVEYMIKKEGNGDFRFPFLQIAEDLREADILFGNLEGPISDKGAKVGSIYSFRATPKAIEGLTFAGFDILSLANNHMFDYQAIALKDTMKILKENEIDYLGAGFDGKEAFSPIIKEINSSEGSPQAKIGFLAYTNLGSKNWKATEGHSGIAWIDEKDIEKIKEDVKKAKEGVDILILSLHSGIEYSPEPTPFQVSFAKACINAGADLVIGHHPHVIQKNEKYEDGWIFYSLGNFVFDQGFSEETMRGQMIKVLIENGKIRTVRSETPQNLDFSLRSKIKEVIPINIRINNYFQPEIVK